MEVIKSLSEGVSYITLAVAAGEVFSSLTLIHAGNSFMRCFVFSQIPSPRAPRIRERARDTSADQIGMSRGEKRAEPIEGHEGGVCLSWTRLYSLIPPPRTQATAGT